MAVPHAIGTVPRSKNGANATLGLRSAGLLALAGGALAVAGFFDLTLAWFPFGFGNPEWEFGTVTATLNALPLPTVGLVLVLVSARERGQLIQSRVIGALFAALALLIILAAVLYALDVPLALRAVQNPLAREGLVKAIIKAAGLVVVYTVVFSCIAVSAWRRSVVR